MWLLERGLTYLRSTVVALVTLSSAASPVHLSSIIGEPASALYHSSFIIIDIIFIVIIGIGPIETPSNTVLVRRALR